MNSRLQGFGRGEHGLITAKLYDDGDLVVCHGERGNCESIGDVSGHGHIINMCDRLDISQSVEDEIIGFVHEHDDLIE